MNVVTNSNLVRYTKKLLNEILPQKFDFTDRKVQLIAAAILLCVASVAAVAVWAFRRRNAAALDSNSENETPVQQQDEVISNPNPPKPEKIFLAVKELGDESETKMSDIHGDKSKNHYGIWTNQSVKTLKENIAKHQGISSDKITLLLNDKSLKDEMKVHDYKLTMGDRIFLKKS